MSKKNIKAYQFLSSLKDHLLCPISKQIMFDPVTAGDGLTYERQAIERWFVKNDTSPSTGKEISKEIVPAFSVKNIINLLLDYNPQLRAEQYVFVKQDHDNSRDDVRRIFAEKKYQSLLGYQKFSLGALFCHCDFDKFLKVVPIDIIKYLVDNTTDLEREDDSDRNIMAKAADASRSDIVKYLLEKRPELIKSDKISMTRPIFEKCNFEIVKGMLEKGVELHKVLACNNYPIHFLLKNTVMSSKGKMELLTFFSNLECQGEKSNRAIHLACRLEVSDGLKNLIIHLIDRGIDLNCSNGEGNYPIHLILSNDHLTVNEKIEILDKFTNLESQNRYGRRAIHLVSNDKSNNKETETLFKYLVNRNVNLECEDNNGLRPIHYLCIKPVTMPGALTYLVEKKVELECVTHEGMKPIHYLLEAGSLGMIKFLIDEGAKCEDVK